MGLLEKGCGNSRTGIPNTQSSHVRKNIARAIAILRALTISCFWCIRSPVRAAAAQELSKPSSIRTGKLPVRADRGVLRESLPKSARTFSHPELPAWADLPCGPTFYNLAAYAQSRGCPRGPLPFPKIPSVDAHAGLSFPKTPSHVEAHAGLSPSPKLPVTWKPMRAFPPSPKLPVTWKPMRAVNYTDSTRTRDNFTYSTTVSEITAVVPHAAPCVDPFTCSTSCSSLCHSFHL